MVKKYRKLPVVIDAIEWNGKNTDAILSFCDKCIFDGTDIIIHTLEGHHRALVGDYIIKGIKNEFYPCKPDIFLKTYEEVIS